MAIKRAKKATKRGKRVKDLTLRGAAAQGTRGGGGGFEIEDFSFGVENPTTIGAATSGAGAGKTSVSQIKIKGK